MKEKILLVDGYNMIAFLKSMKQDFKKGKLDAARTTLLRILSHYASFENIDIICVFDAHHVPGSRQHYDEFNVQVVFTDEEETTNTSKLALPPQSQPHIEVQATLDYPAPLCPHCRG